MTSKFNRRGLLRLSAEVAAGVAALGYLPSRARAQENESPPPPIELYVETPLVDQIALSPDGKRVAVISQMGDNKLLLCFFIGGAPTNTLNLGPVKIRDLFWGDNDRVVIVDSVATTLRRFPSLKQEFSMGRVLDLRTNKVHTLFDHDKEFLPSIMGGIHRTVVDGKATLMAANYRMSDDFNLCLFQFDLDSPHGRLVCDASSQAYDFVIDADGYVVACAEFDEQHKQWTLLYNTVPRGKLAQFHPVYKMKEAIDIPSLEGLSRDGQSVIVYFSTGENAGEYHEVSASGVIGPVIETADDGSTSPLYHPKTLRLAGFAYHDDWVRYEYTDPLLKKIAEGLGKTMGDDYRYAILGFADDLRQMIVYGEDAQDAGTYTFVDLSNGRVETVASNYTDVPNEWISQKTPLTYTAADGLEIHAYLTLPPGREAKALPLIVLPHGGPQSRDRIGFDWQSQALASRGYAVLQPNFRGSSGYGHAFVAAGHGEFGRKMQTDLNDGVRHLVKQNIADPKRVAILGASYGGYAALAGATLDTGIYRCAISIAGISDPSSFVSFIAQRGGYGNSNMLYLKRYLGDPKNWDEISPVQQANKASCPILLIHGTDDTVVPIDQSRRMESALKRAGKPVEFVTYKGQDHWETVGSSRIEMMKAAMTFLDRHNPA